MLIDKLLDWLFELLEWVLGLLPDMPVMTELNHDYMNAVYSINMFMDIRAVMDAVGVLVGVLTAFAGFAGVNWIINKIRGSG